jgi:integrase
MAEVELHRMMAEASDPDARQDSVTFEQASDEYLRYVEHVRQIDIATVKDYRGVIDGYLRAESGALLIDAITPDLIDAYKERLIAEGRLSARVIVRHLTVLHGIFKRAGRAYGLKRNPASADLVERPRVVYTGEFDTFSGEEVELLAAAAQDDQDGAIYRVAAFTGLRQGELLALRWSDVDFVGGLLHVRRNYTDGREKMPKGKRVRSVPMTPRVIDTLGRLKDRGYLAEDGDLVFCNSAGGYLDSWALRRRYYRALKKGGSVGSGSMTCATVSGRRRSRSSTPMRCSPIWATSTTRRHSGICTTSHGRRTRRRCMRPSAARTCPRTCPELTQSRRTESN